MEIIVKTLEGLEDVLAEELESLHLTGIEKLTRGVRCYGSTAQLYKCNYLLRTAIRVLVPIQSFTLETEQDLYDAIYSISWYEYINTRRSFAIDATVFGELFNNSQFVTYRTKDAIADKLMSHFGSRPDVDRKNPDILVNVLLSNNKLSVSLDSSGRSLHLRNYKYRSYLAPLSEVLAAGIIKLSGWKGERPFVDPMCGSGTFTTEALMQAANVPAGKFIERFSFQNWMDHERTIWDTVKGQADAQIQKPETKIFSSDIKDYAVRDLKKNLQKIPQKDSVKITQEDFFKKEAIPDSEVFLNPPYDKRIKLNDSGEYYKRIADQLKFNWSSSNAWVISSHNQAMKSFGLKSTKKHVLDNGGLAAKLYKYELYEGARESKFQQGEEE